MGDQGLEEVLKSRKKCQITMIIFLICSFSVHIARFYVIVFLEADVIREVLDWVILIVYTVVTFAFLPLFVALMTLL